MNDIKGIIEDVKKSSLVSNKVIDKVRELIGKEKWNELYDECNDICTTTGELIITLKGIAEFEKENEKLKILLQQCYQYHLHSEVSEYPYDKVEKFFNEGVLC
jgi:hypothetical protein